MGRVGSNLTITPATLFPASLSFLCRQCERLFYRKGKVCDRQVDSINCFLVTGVDEGEMLFKIFSGILEGEKLEAYLLINNIIGFFLSR